MVNIGNEWDNLLADQFQSEYYRKLRAFLVDEYNRYNVYPPADCIFNALKYTPYSKVKAVICRWASLPTGQGREFLC